MDLNKPNHILFKTEGIVGTEQWCRRRLLHAKNKDWKPRTFFFSFSEM